MVYSCVCIEGKGSSLLFSFTESAIIDSPQQLARHTSRERDRMEVFSTSGDSPGTFLICKKLPVMLFKSVESVASLNKPDPLANAVHTCSSSILYVQNWSLLASSPGPFPACQSLIVTIKNIL